MMEREINLLPPQAIHTRTVRIYFGRTGQLIRFIVFLAGLLLIVLGAVYVVVWRMQVSTAADTAQKDEQQVATLQHVRKVNDQVAAIKSWQIENEPWTARLPEVLRVMPADIVLTLVGVKREGAPPVAGQAVLELGGTFGQRESLVAFQRQLEALVWVGTVESPLSNFTTGSEARFSLLIHPKP